MNGEHDFRDVTRLLALKRHEQPPPGYFSRFSREVITGIKAAATDERSSGLGWLQRLWIALETKPIAAGSFGAAVCGLMLGGLLFSDSSEPSFGNMPHMDFAPGYQAASDSGTSLGSGSPFASIIGSNGLPSQTGPSLFDAQIFSTDRAADPRRSPFYSE